MNQQRLLILACSATKCGRVHVPAITLYNGVMYRVYRAGCERNPTAHQQVEVLILSAKYGLLTAMTPISPYDQKMTRSRARDLIYAGTVQAKLRPYMAKPYREIFVAMGKTYRLALGDVIDGAGAPVTYTHGGIGQQMQQLCTWLASI